MIGWPGKTTGSAEMGRGTFVELEGELQPAPAPRFSHSPSLPRPATSVVADAHWLADWARPGP